jgi:tetratricopeptide (TPR) repeat protein
MRKVNGKFLGYLVSSIALFTAALIAVHWLQSGRIARALLWQAEHAQEQGRYRHAARYLNRYLEFVPSDLEKRAELGSLLARPDVAVSARGVAQASLVLNQVLSEDPDRHELRRMLAKLLIRARQLDTAKEQLDILQKALPGNCTVAEVAGDWFEAAGKFQEAEAAWRDALKGRPDDTELMVRLAGLLSRNRGIEAVDSEVDKYIGLAYGLSPSDPGVVVAAADRAQETGDLKKARDLLEKGLKAAPQDGRLHLSLATLEVREGRRPEAIKLLRDAIKNHSEKHRFELTWTLVNLLIDDNQLDAARKAIAGLGKGEGVRDTVMYLEARCRMTQSCWHDAARALETVRPSFEGSPQIATQIDLYLGACYANLREPGTQFEAFSRAARRSPSSVPARLGVIGALLALGKSTTALQEYRGLMSLKDAPGDGWVEIARLVLEINVRSGRPNWDEVDEAVSKVAQAKIDTAEVAQLRAQVLVAKGKMPEARALLAEQQRANPKTLSPWIADAVLANRQSGPRAALALLDKARLPEYAGDSLELRLAAAEFAKELPAEQAKSCLSQLEKKPGLPADKAAQLWLGLAEANVFVKDYTEAARLYKQVCAVPAYAQDVGVRLSCFDVALRAGDEQSMFRVLEEIKSLESSDGLNAQYGLAVHHVWKARSDSSPEKWLNEAGIILDRLAQKRPDWSAVMLARAEIEELRGNVDKALNHYSQAFAQGERNMRALRQYGLLLLKCRRHEELDALVRKFEKVGGASAELRQMGAFASMRGGNIERAHELIAPGPGPNSRDFRDMMWYGQVLASAGKNAAAEKALRRAAEMAGNEPDPWVALTRFFGTTGKKDRGEAVIQIALTKLPAEKRAITAAQCYDSLGDANRADKYFQAALNECPLDVTICRAAAVFYLRVQDATHADQCLRRIIDHKVLAAPPDVAWAKHKLAVAIALRGDYRRFGEALALVGLALDNTGNPLEKRQGGIAPAEEMAARARVLATQGRAAFRERAIVLLEDLNKRQALLPEDRFLLAQLYESSGPESNWWVKVLEQMGQLNKRLGDDPSYLSQFASWRIRHKEFPEAEALIDRIEKLEQQRRLPSGTLGSVELRVGLLEATQRPDEALSLLRDYVTKRKDDPERVFFLIGALQRRKQMAEALEYCEKAWKTCSPEPAGGASLATLKVGRPGDEDYRRVETWIQESLKRKPDSPVLSLQLADLYEMQGRLDQAEAIYRDVLRRDKENPVALNNLAWHLSQRPGRGAEALPLIDRALELLGPQASLLDTRAAVHLRTGRGDLAVADLEKVARDDPSATRLFRLAQAQHLTRDAKAAIASLERAKNSGLDPDRLQPAERESYQKMIADLRTR